MAYSIVETAKENDLIPYEYLEYLFERLPNLADDAGLEELMPWSDSIPERCRMGKAT
jgi:transposase